MISQTKLSFFLQTNKTNLLRKTPIYLRIRYQNEEQQLSTGITIDKDRWNSKSKRLHGKNHEEQSINDQLLAIEIAVRTIVSDSLAKGLILSAKQIKELLNRKAERPETIINGFELYCKRMDTLIGKDFCKATVARYRHTKDRIEEFIKDSFKQKDIQLNKVNDAFMEDFESFLKTTYKNDHTTIYKHYQRITKVLRYYLKRHAIEKFPLIEYQIRPNKKKVEYLDTVEINAIENKKIEIIRLDVIRDLLCIQHIQWICLYRNVQPLRPSSDYRDGQQSMDKYESAEDG